MPTLSDAKLRATVQLILEHAGSSAAEAETVTDHLVRANLAGHDSHGVGMVPTYIKNIKAGLLKANQDLETVKDEGSILMFDGQRGYGQVQAKRAMEAALERCQRTGLVLMTLRNAHHIGRIGSYGEQSISAGFVSLHFVNVTDHVPVVAPYGGTKARFVTNPICLAMPGTQQTEPLLLDMATSKIALGKARVAMNANLPVPEASLLDAAGQPTTDPQHLFAEPYGALLPFGDYKGSGLALFCELLAGGLSGGGTIQPGNEHLGGIVNNMFTLVLDPERLVDGGWLRDEFDALIRYVKDTPPQADTGPVRVAGEPELETRKLRQAEGIPLAERSWKGIVGAALEVGVSRDELEKLIA